VSMRLIDVCTTTMMGARELYYACMSMTLIFGPSLDVINEVKTFLCQSFDTKDLGEADVILNKKLIEGENEITLM
jgi:hypothetical protein